MPDEPLASDEPLEPLEPLELGEPSLLIPDEPPEEPEPLLPLPFMPVDPPELPVAPVPDAPDDPLLLVPEDSELLVSELPLVSERDGFFFDLLLSVEVVSEEPEDPVVPDMSVLPDAPDEPVIPLLPDESDDPVLPVVPELWAMTTPVPSVETRTAIKSFFIGYLHHKTRLINIAG